MNRIIHYSLTITIALLTGISTTYQIPALSLLTFALALFVILKGNYGQSFCTLLCTSYFSACFSYGTFGYFFMLPLIGSLRNLTKCRIPISFAVCLLLFLMIFSGYELYYSTPGKMLERVSYLLYLFSLMYSFSFNKYNHVDTVVLFMICLGVVNFFAIEMSGGLTGFLVQSAMDNLRMGDADMDKYASDTLDGAMGFPIHTILMMSLSLPFFINKGIRVLSKVLLSLILLVFFLVTFLTTSKVYLLGLATFGICLLLHIVKGKNRIAIIFIIILFFLILSTQSWFFDLVYERYAYRIEDTDTDVTSGRTDIYKSCIDYLSDNFLALLFGSSYDGYLEIGRLLNKDFKMSAHNIILDGLMSFGLYGCSLLLISVKQLNKKARLYIKSKASLLGWLPIICWFVMCQTNTTFYLAKTYPLIPFLVIHIHFWKQLTGAKAYERES